MSDAHSRNEELLERAAGDCGVERTENDFLVELSRDPQGLLELRKYGPPAPAVTALERIPECRSEGAPFGEVGEN